MLAAHKQPKTDFPGDAAALPPGAEERRDEESTKSLCGGRRKKGPPQAGQGPEEADPSGQKPCQMLNGIMMEISTIARPFR